MEGVAIANMDCRLASSAGCGPKRPVACLLPLKDGVGVDGHVGARRGRRDPARAHGGAVWRWTRRLPCGARGRGASHNSLRALRALRSDRCDENVDEARCARHPCRCATRRPTNRPRRVPPAATLGLWCAVFWDPTVRSPGARRQRRVGAGRGAPSGAPRSTGLAASAKRVRPHAHRHCLSEESEANAASLAMRPQDRAPQGSRRVQRSTAPVKRRDRPPHAFAAP